MTSERRQRDVLRWHARALVAIDPEAWVSNEAEADYLSTVRDVHDACATVLRGTTLDPARQDT